MGNSIGFASRKMFLGVLSVLPLFFRSSSAKIFGSELRDKFSGANFGILPALLFSLAQLLASTVLAIIVHDILLRNRLSVQCRRLFFRGWVWVSAVSFSFCLSPSSFFWGRPGFPSSGLGCAGAN